MRSDCSQYVRNGSADITSSQTYTRVLNITGGGVMAAHLPSKMKTLRCSIRSCLVVEGMRPNMSAEKSEEYNMRPMISTPIVTLHMTGACFTIKHFFGWRGAICLWWGMAGSLR